MPAQSNIDMLEKVKGSIEASKGLFVVDYRGLTVKDAQELRRALREAGAHMKVYKNNIVRIALKDAEMPNIDEMLKGTCALRLLREGSCRGRQSPQAGGRQAQEDADSGWHR
jgi:large subunit ribosomal protein L10